MKKWFIHMPAVLLLFMLILAAALLSGCGDEQQATTSAKVVCDPAAPSIIPAPSERPQVVEFYRDT